jgi:hypothetical protein
MKKVSVLVCLCLLSAFIYAQDLDMMHCMLVSHGEVTMAEKTRGTITKNELLTAGAIKLKKLFRKYHVVEFDMTIVSKEKKLTTTYHNFSNGNLTAEMRAAIMNASDGDKIYFEYIRSRDEKGVVLYFCSPITLKLKEYEEPWITTVKK